MWDHMADIATEWPAAVVAESLTVGVVIRPLIPLLSTWSMMASHMCCRWSSAIWCNMFVVRDLKESASSGLRWGAVETWIKKEVVASSRFVLLAAGGSVGITGAVHPDCSFTLTLSLV